MLLGAESRPELNQIWVMRFYGVIKATKQFGMLDVCKVPDHERRLPQG
jgi:hypothetical protein